MTTYYVDAVSGNDTTGDGSSGNPWQTIAKLYASWANNDTGILRAGKYWAMTSTTNKTGVTLRGADGETAILKSSYTWAADTWAKTAGYTNVYDTAWIHPAPQSVWNDTTRLTSVANAATCDSTANSFYADTTGDKLYINVGGVPPDMELIIYNDWLSTLSGANVTLRDLTFQWVYQALNLTGSAPTLDNCKFQYGAAYSTATDSWGYIRITGANAIIRNCTFSGNVVDIGLNSASSAATIINCTASAGSYFIWANGGSHTAYNCTANTMSAAFYANAGTLSCFDCIAIDSNHGGFESAAGATINTTRCIANCTQNIGTGAQYGWVFHGNGSAYHCIAANTKRSTNGLSAYDCATTGNVTIKNCIAYNCKEGIGDTTDDTPPAGLWDADYNCFYACTTPYTTGYSAATHDIAVDPLFRLDLAGSDDFRLLPGSPCIDAGILVTGVNEGFRGGAPDIGALEYIKPLPAHRHNS